MALMVLKNPQCTINAIDLSTLVSEVAITYEAKEVDTTAGNAAGAESVVPGLLKWSAEVTFNQDFSAGLVDATLFPLVGAAAFACLFRPSTAVKGPTNPEYTGNAILPSYSPISTKVGDLITTKVKFSGSGVLGRAVA